METEFFEAEFAKQVRDLAQVFPYPATPNVAGRVMSQLRGGQRRLRSSFTPVWVWITALIILLFTGLMAVPSVRAAILEFLQIGAIRIFLEETTPPIPPIDPAPTRPLPEESETPGGLIVVLPTRTPSESQFLTSVLELAGEVSLEEAREQFSFPILLPMYPPDLGAPDKVFAQQLEGGKGIFLVWLDSEQPESVSMSLLLLAPGVFAGKGAPVAVIETEVNGTRAVWTEGEHLLHLQTGPQKYDLVQLFVEGNVLIWEQDGVTYRLEGEFDLQEAVRIAESIQ